MLLSKVQTKTGRCTVLQLKQVPCLGRARHDLRAFSGLHAAYRYQRTWAPYPCVIQVGLPLLAERVQVTEPCCSDAPRVIIVYWHLGTVGALCLMGGAMPQANVFSDTRPAVGRMWIGPLQDSNGSRARFLGRGCMPSYAARCHTRGLMPQQCAQVTPGLQVT
jgi:hypothetical protein